MSRSDKLFQAEVATYAEDLLVQSLRSGYADPVLLVECVHYAAEPEVIAFTRSFAALDECARAEVMRIVQALSLQRTGPSLKRHPAH